MENQPSADQLEAIAKQLACPEGEHGIKTGEMMNVSNIGMTRSAIDAMELKDGDQVLEIGHGNGGHISHLLGKATNLKYFGADISKTIIAEAERINTGFIKEKRVSFTLSNAESLPFEDNKFDKIFTVNTLYFWINPADYLKEIKRVLKPAGTFVLCFADKSFMEKLPFTQFGFRLYALEDARTLLVDGGFKIHNATKHTEEINSNAGFMVTRDYYCIAATSLF